MISSPVGFKSLHEGLSCVHYGKLQLLQQTYHRLDGLSTKHLFLTVLKPKKSKLKMPANLIPHENPFPGLQKPTFLLYAHMVRD